MSDLWVAASRDVESDNAEVALTLAKMAAAPVWPFLALAGTEREFGHRLALALPEVERLVPDAGVRDQVLASFRADFTGVHEAAQAAVEPLEVYHVASGRWIQVESVESPSGHNPAYDDVTPEGGPATGVESEHFPLAAPDPVNPINEQYPAQPQAWTVPPDKAWVERPMNFGPYQQATAAVGDPRYTDEGVETGKGPNPNYFGGGSEGATGDPQGGYPVDESLPEQDERVDFYGAVPPVVSGGSGPGETPYSNGASRQAYKAHGPTSGETADRQRTNHGACASEGCNRPVYREGNRWKHLEGEQDHHVLLDAAHPWVQQQMTRNSARAGGFHDPLDPSVRMTRRADASSSDLGTGQSAPDPAMSGDAAAPNVPPSMVNGGPGAMAMPGGPQTIPNAMVSANPFAGGSPSAPPVTGALVTADQVRERPSALNPSGVSDEYQNNTWDNVIRQRPMQSPDERKINTPQQPIAPIPQVSSDGGARPEGRDREENQEEDED